MTATFVEVEPDTFATLDRVLSDPARVESARSVCRQKLRALDIEVRRELGVLVALGVEPAAALEMFRDVSRGSETTPYTVDLRLKDGDEAA